MSRAKTARRSRRLEGTAHHEAGHAVARYLLGLRFKSVSIEAEGDSLGCVKGGHYPRGFDLDLKKNMRARAYAERKIMVSLAGHAAEAIWRGRHSWCGSRRDYDDVADLTEYLCFDQDEERAYVRWLAIRTRHLLRGHWGLVEGLAAALLERRILDYREARKAMQAKLDAEVKRVLKGWAGHAEVVVSS